MKKNKYNYFIVVTDMENETISNYKDAVKMYSNADSATLYGVDEQGEYNVIYSK